jgi:hypothetical protein
MRQYIGGVIAERNILSPLCLLVETSPFNLAFARGNGNRYFTQKLHVKIANNPRSSQSQTDAHIQYCLLPDPSNFSLLSTYKALFCHSIWHPRCPKMDLFKIQYEIAATYVQSHLTLAWLRDSGPVKNVFFLLLKSKKSLQKRIRILAKEQYPTSVLMH